MSLLVRDVPRRRLQAALEEARQGRGATVLVSASGIYQAPDKVEAARTLAAIARGDDAGSHGASDHGRGAD